MLAVFIASVFTACGGGGGDGGGGGSTGVTNTPVTSSGTVTAFGSVIVNGVRYDTSNARIISADDGAVVLENPTNAELQALIGLGQVITVQGTRSSSGGGVASSVLFDDELVGAVTSVSAADGSFVVLGQTVSVTPETIIDDSMIEAVRGTEIPNDLPFGGLPETLDQLLTVGMVVEVSGFPSQNGLEATRIEDVKNQPGGGGAGGGLLDDEVKGFVSNLVSGQFEINGLTVIYDDSDLDSEDFSNRPLANGQFVEVHGTAISPTMIEATRIELESQSIASGSSGGRIEIEGIIQSIRPDAQGTGGVLVINGVEIRVSDVRPFSEGIRVRLVGTLQADGSIVISSASGSSSGENIRTEDLVVSTDGTTLVTRLGLRIQPGNRSRLEDDTIDDDDNLSIADFLGNAVGKRIEARGFPLNGDVVWTRLEIEDENDQDCKLRGPVANITGSVNDFSFTILGIVIDVSQVADNNFEGSADQPIGRTAFFNQLRNGVIVEVESDAGGSGCADGVLMAREVEFEPPKDIFIGGGNGNGFNNNEVNGMVSSVSGNTFVVAGQAITANASTLIDDSIVEAARGVELSADDIPLGNLPETLAQLLPVGLSVEVTVDRSNGLLALRIEDR